MHHSFALDDTLIEDDETFNISLTTSLLMLALPHSHQKQVLRPLPYCRIQMIVSLTKIYDGIIIMIFLNSTNFSSQGMYTVAILHKICAFCSMWDIPFTMIMVYFRGSDPASKFNY